MAQIQVRSLTGPLFAQACAELQREVDARFSPALLIGIRTGGYTVALAMQNAALQSSGGRSLAVAPLTCRRASTKTKGGVPGLAAVLTRLPVPVLDQLRRVEHRLLTGRKRPPGERVLDPAEQAALQAQLSALAAGSNVVAIDDAVDSGATLATVLAFARAAVPPGVAVHSAAITVTTEQPVARPDVALYTGVLCRFPWSFDAA